MTLALVPLYLRRPPPPPLTVLAAPAICTGSNEESAVGDTACFTAALISLLLRSKDGPGVLCFPALVLRSKGSTAVLPPLCSLIVRVSLLTSPLLCSLLPCSPLIVRVNLLAVGAAVPSTAAAGLSPIEEPSPTEELPISNGSCTALAPLAERCLPRILGRAVPVEVLPLPSEDSRG